MRNCNNKRSEKREKGSPNKLTHINTSPRTLKTHTASQKTIDEKHHFIAADENRGFFLKQVRTCLCNTRSSIYYEISHLLHVY